MWHAMYSNQLKVFKISTFGYIYITLQPTYTSTPQQTTGKKKNNANIIKTSLLDSQHSTLY